jgi:hypothetical protein
MARSVGAEDTKAARFLWAAEARKALGGSGMDIRLTPKTTSKPARDADRHAVWRRRWPIARQCPCRPARDHRPGDKLDYAALRRTRQLHQAFCTYDECGHSHDSSADRPADRGAGDHE